MGECFVIGYEGVVFDVESVGGFLLVGVDVVVDSLY